MKKLQLGVVCALLLILACGCTSVPQEPLPPREYGAYTYAPSEVRPAPYTSLSYSGIDTNPQNMPNSYHVSNDSSFVADIWDALDCDAWTEQKEGSPAMVSIKLTFSDESSFLSVEIDPNDTGWRRNDTGSAASEKIEYFSLPAGTYNRVKFLLMTYTSEHFMPDISPKLLEIDIENGVPLVFSSGEIYFQLLPELAGDFTSGWNMDTWEETPTDYVSSDGKIEIRGIYCKDGRGPVEVTADKSQKYVLITYDGISKIYKVPEGTVQTIYSQFDSFHLLSQS